MNQERAGQPIPLISFPGSERLKRNKEAARQRRMDDAIDRVTEVLVAHQRQDAGSCLCGWGKLGASHVAHQARFVIAALKGDGA